MHDNIVIICSLGHDNLFVKVWYRDSPSLMSSKAVNTSGFHFWGNNYAQASKLGQTSCIESKMVQSKLVRATATSHVFKLSMRAVLCCSSELSVNGFWRGEINIKQRLDQGWLFFSRHPTTWKIDTNTTQRYFLQESLDKSYWQSFEASNTTPNMLHMPTEL